MGNIIIGTEAVTAGIVTRYELYSVGSVRSCQISTRHAIASMTLTDALMRGRPFSTDEVTLLAERYKSRYGAWLG